MCRCPGGVAAAPALSLGSAEGCIEDEIRCTACDEFHMLDGPKCKPKTCFCTNGEAAVGEQCVYNNIEKCVRCDPGYVMTEDATCRENQCTCRGGTPAVGGVVGYRRS